MSALPMLQGGGGKSLNEIISELGVKTFTFGNTVQSKIVFPETGVYLVIIPSSMATVAALSGVTPLFTPSYIKKVVNNSSNTTYKTTYYYTLIQCNTPGGYWTTNAFVGSSGTTSGYILAKLKEL